MSAGMRTLVQLAIGMPLGYWIGRLFRPYIEHSKPLQWDVTIVLIVAFIALLEWADRRFLKRPSDPN